MLLVLALVVRRRSKPPLVGSLTMLRNGQVVREVLLEGRSQSLNAKRGASPLTARLTGLRRKDAEAGELPGVRVVARSQGRTLRAELFDGDEFRVGDVTARYTSQRTRMIQLITAPLL